MTVGFVCGLKPKCENNVGSGKEKRGRTSRPSPQSPKGILGSSPPRGYECKPLATSNYISFSALKSNTA